MRQDWLTFRAPAKINLYLRVTGRRPDGYHTLDTFMQKVSLYDTLEFRVCERQGIYLRCVGGPVPENSDNLVYRAAAQFLRSTCGQRPLDAGVEIVLHKQIPTSAGLGGGSSDAATTLHGLNELFGCGCVPEELAAMGLRLGADVPFFLARFPAAVATGIGEILQPAKTLAGWSVLLVNPGFPVSTQWVYQSFALTETKNASKLKSLKEGVDVTRATGEMYKDGPSLAFICNDLESVTVFKFPEIERLKKELLSHGAAAALMSGSGPTVFGLFADHARAEACRAQFSRRFEHTYLVAPIGEE